MARKHPIIGLCVVGLIDIWSTKTATALSIVNRLSRRLVQIVRRRILYHN